MLKFIPLVNLRSNVQGSLIQKIRSKKTTQTNTSGLMNIFSQFFKWANRFYILLVWLDARITPRSLSAVLLIKAEKNQPK